MEIYLYDYVRENRTSHTLAKYNAANEQISVNFLPQEKKGSAEDGHEPARKTDKVKYFRHLGYIYPLFRIERKA